MGVRGMQLASGEMVGGIFQGNSREWYILFVSTGFSALVFNASRATLDLSHWHDPDSQL